ncbi:hypothetical protein CRYUN_Cryun19dG0154800 [Craigia yunnanensis]
MDSKVHSDKITQKLARELLIAISYSLPDTDLNSDHASKNVDGTNGAVVANADEAEKYRSVLISISNTQSPDAQVPPVVLGNHDVPEFVCLVLIVEIFCSVSFKQLSRPSSFTLWTTVFKVDQTCYLPFYSTPCLNIPSVSDLSSSSLLDKNLQADMVHLDSSSGTSSIGEATNVGSVYH